MRLSSELSSPAATLHSPIGRRDRVILFAGCAVMLVTLGAFTGSLAADTSLPDGEPREWLLLASFGAAGTCALVVFVRLARARALAAEMARIDPQTRLPNRVAAEEHLRRVSASAARHGTTYGVLLIDVDPFKSINDTYGRGLEDDVLCEMGVTLSRTARRSDFVSRWGGEEFLIVVTDVDRGHLVSAAERFRSCAGAVRQAPGGGRVATVSIGGAVGRSEDASPTVATADAALYTAKAAGRNCAVIAEDRCSRDELSAAGDPSAA